MREHLKKVHKIAEDFQATNEVIICTKHRDENGKLSKTLVPLTEESLDKDLIIIDDICDGGGTFVNIGKAIKENKDFKGKVFLIVTHGIFTRGFETLSEYFDKIYTTNSVKDIRNDVIVNTFSKNKTVHSLVKQFNIF